MLPSVLGVSIHGTVYDFGLNKLSNTVVEINSTPAQKIVASNGTYAFSVSPGSYTLKARHDKSDSETVEIILAMDEGEYVLDLILLPSIVNEEVLLEETEIPLVEDIVEDKPATQWFLWVVVFAVLAYLVYKISRPRQIIEKIKEVVKEVAVPEDLQKIMEFIENEGGRSTQKDIRKNFPYSEAKISLMIDELEAKGLVKKVKKGRGNIILKS